MHFIWLTLDNDSQLAFFHSLQKLSIRDAINVSGVPALDVQNVIIQIEAKDFCSNNSIDKGLQNNVMTQFFLTNACNLRCPHCYMVAGKEAPNELSFSEVTKALRVFADHGGKKVTFSGGEVRVRRDSFEILKFCKAIGLRTQVFTNGTLWNDIEFNSEQTDSWIGLIDEVQVSIDGYSEETNAVTRGKGNYARSLHCVDMFVKAGVKTEVAVTPLMSKELESQVDNYISWGRGLLEKYKGRSFSMKFSGELMDGRDVSLTDEEQLKFGQIMDSIYRGVYGEDVAARAFASFVLQKQRMHGCTFGSFNVTSNGDIYACGRITGMTPMANVRTCSYDEVFKQLADATRLADIDNLKPCRDCELRYFCGGDCRVKYFAGFAQARDYTNLRSETIGARACTRSNKERFYNLMIDADPLLFQ